MIIMPHSFLHQCFCFVFQPPNLLLSLQQAQIDSLPGVQLFPSYLFSLELELNFKEVHSEEV